MFIRELVIVVRRMDYVDGLDLGYMIFIEGRS